VREPVYNGFREIKALFAPSFCYLIVTGMPCCLLHHVIRLLHGLFMMVYNSGEEDGSLSILGAKVVNLWRRES